LKFINALFYVFRHLHSEVITGYGKYDAKNKMPFVLNEVFIQAR
jgi:hypothetical protein